MENFDRKPIESIETLGEKLKRHRLEAGYTINQVGKLMRLSPRYIELIESDAFDCLPPGVYIKKFLENYANFLNLNSETVIYLYNQEIALNEKLKKDDSKSLLKKDNIWQKLYKFILSPITLRYFFSSIVILTVLFYLGLSINKIFLPPELIIKNPEKPIIKIKESNITIEGITEKEVDLTINGKQVLCDQNGNFVLNIDLQQGLNLITISAKKKHSQPHIEYRQIFVEN